MSTPIPFSKQLKIWLVEVGITQRELAEAIGRAESTVSHIVTGAREPSDEILNEIAKALNKPPLEVYIAAGRIPDQGDTSDLSRLLVFIFDQYEEGEQQFIVELLDAFLQRRRKRDKAQEMTNENDSERKVQEDGG